jgi:hypothetical protein
MFEDLTGVGGMAAVLGPAVLGAWLVWRWVRRVIRLALLAVLGTGAAWLGLDPLGAGAPAEERAVAVE